MNIYFSQITCNLKRIIDQTLDLYPNNKSSVMASSSYNVTHINLIQLFLTTLPLWFIVLISNRLKLHLEKPLVIGIVRTFFQLLIVGLILTSIFEVAGEHPILAVFYLLFMSLIASLELNSRLKYTFAGLFIAVSTIFFIYTCITGILLFNFIIHTTPSFDPQYVIPILGMILGSALAGVTQGLDIFLKGVVERRNEIELYLAFGASKFEACQDLVREAVNAAMMATLNSMAVIGIVSIPGMMTGQIVGGSVPKEAAVYQTMIMYMLACARFTTTSICIAFVMSSSFNEQGFIKPIHFFKKQDTPKLFGSSIIGVSKVHKLSISRCWEKCDNIVHHLMESFRSIYGIFNPTGCRYQLVNSVEAVSMNLECFTKLNFNEKCYSESSEVTLEVKNLSYGFDDYRKDPESGVVLETAPTAHHLISNNLSVGFKASSITFITGLSGAGKTTFVKTLAKLHKPSNGKVVLKQVTEMSTSSFQSWRKRVRYVTQSRITIPGTPQEFLTKISNFQVQERKLAASWAKNVENCLSKLDLGVEKLIQDWKTLSEGEAQRVFLAICLTSDPEVFLLDEAGSALDLDTKLKLENIVTSLCLEGKTFLWVTHDLEQIERL